MSKVKILILVLMGIGLLVCASSYADLADGIIAAWTFDDGTAKDSVGKNNGKIHDGVEVVSGKFGKAMKFNGTDGWIEVPHNKAFEVMANALSASAWINVSSGKDHSAIVYKGEKIGWTNNYVFRIATLSNTSMTWGVCIPGTEGWFATDNVIKPNEWYFVCLTADGKQAIAHVASEKDGKVNIPLSGQGNPHAIAAPYRTCPEFPIEIGVGRAVGGTVGNDAYYGGIIDEIYLWDRALNEDEIAQLAKGTRPKGGFPVEPAGRLAITWGAIKESGL